MYQLNLRRVSRFIIEHGIILKHDNHLMINSLQHMKGLGFPKLKNIENIKNEGE